MAKRQAYKFTQRAQETFLTQLAVTANVRDATAAAGVDCTTVYKHRRADPAFAHAWRMAILAGYDRIELALIRRALGLKNEAGEDGETVGELDVDLAMRLLVRYKPLVVQATTEAVAATFRASRDVAAELLLTKLSAYARRTGLRAPAEPLILVHDAATTT